jgi:hypothetical protein
MHCHSTGAPASARAYASFAFFAFAYLFRILGLPRKLMLRVAGLVHATVRLRYDDVALLRFAHALHLAGRAVDGHILALLVWEMERPHKDLL